MRIYGDMTSGNCLKAKYAADLLGLEYTWVPVDIQNREAQGTEYLALNPQGQVPLLGLDDGRHIAQSNAILRYLAHGTTLLPAGRYEQAKIDEWLFWEQYSHEPNVAVCRSQMVYQGKAKDEREPWRVDRAEAALDYMERMLGRSAWLVGEDFSIADIALIAYTRLAPEGGFDLAPRRNIRRWMRDTEDLLKLS